MDVSKYLAPVLAVHREVQSGRLRLNICQLGLPQLVIEPEGVQTSNQKGSASATIIAIGKLLHKNVVIKISFRNEREEQNHDNSEEFERYIYAKLVPQMLKYTPHLPMIDYVGECKQWDRSLTALEQKHNFTAKRLREETLAIQKFDNRYDINDTYFLITEKCPGKKLEDWIKQDGNRLNGTFWTPVMFQIAYTLYIFQLFKFTHNDLHAGNIFVDAAPSEMMLHYRVDGQTYQFKTRYFVRIYDFDQGGLDTNIKNDRNKILDYSGCRGRGQCNEFIKSVDWFNILIWIYVISRWTSQTALGNVEWLTDYIDENELERQFRSPPNGKFHQQGSASWIGRACLCRDPKCQGCDIQKQLLSSLSVKQFMESKTFAPNRWNFKVPPHEMLFVAPDSSDEEKKESSPPRLPVEQIIPPRPKVVKVEEEGRKALPKVKVPAAQLPTQPAEGGIRRRGGHNFLLPAAEELSPTLKPSRQEQNRIGKSPKHGIQQQPSRQRTPKSTVKPLSPKSQLHQVLATAMVDSQCGDTVYLPSGHISTVLQAVTYLNQHQPRIPPKTCVIVYNKPDNNIYYLSQNLQSHHFDPADKKKLPTFDGMATEIEKNIPSLQQFLQRPSQKQRQNGGAITRKLSLEEIKDDTCVLSRIRFLSETSSNGLQQTLQLLNANQRFILKGTCILSLNINQIVISARNPNTNYFDAQTTHPYPGSENWAQIKTKVPELVL